MRGLLNRLRRKLIVLGTPASLAGLLLWCSVAALSGIIGGRADAGFVKSIWPIINQPLQMPMWGAFVLLFAFLCVFFSSDLHHRSKYKLLEGANQLLDKLKSLDDLFLDLLSQLEVSHDTETALKQLLDAYLSEVLNIFDSNHPDPYHLDKCHVIIYRPDPTAPTESLVAWYGYWAPQEDMREARFPLGNLPKGGKRGIAGKAFLDKSSDCVQVVHIFKDESTDRWLTSDDENYLFIHDQKLRQIPSHRVLAAIPLVNAATEDKEKIGVLCFYCRNELAAFEQRQFKEELLPMFAHRISTAVQVASRIDFYQSRKSTEV